MTPETLVLLTKTIIYIIIGCVLGYFAFAAFKTFWEWHFPRPDKEEVYKTQCDACGKYFKFPIHKHYSYNSCSVECDDFLDDVFEEQNY